MRVLSVYVCARAYNKAIVSTRSKEKSFYLFRGLLDVRASFEKCFLAQKKSKANQEKVRVRLLPKLCPFFDHNKISRPKKVDIFFLTFSFSVRLCPHCSAGGLLASNTVYRKKKKKKLLETLLPSYLPGSPIPQRRGGKVPSIKGRCCCAASSSKIDAHSGSSSARLAVMKSGHSRAISSFSLPPSSVIDVPSQQRIKKKKSCVRHAHNSLPIRLLQRVS